MATTAAASTPPVRAWRTTAAPPAPGQPGTRLSRLSTDSRLISTVSLIEPLLASALAVPRHSMGTRRPAAGSHLLGLARRLASCRRCRSEGVSPPCAPLTTDAVWDPLVTLRPFAPPAFRHDSSRLLRLTPGSLSRSRSPRVRTCAFDPCRQALPNASFGDGWISRSLARLAPAPGLAAYARVLAPRPPASPRGFHLGLHYASRHSSRLPPLRY